MATAFPFVIANRADPRLVSVGFFLTPQDLVPFEDFGGETMLQTVQRKLQTVHFAPRSFEELLAWQEGRPIGDFLLAFKEEEIAEHFFARLAASIPCDLSLGRVLDALLVATDGFTAVENVVVMLPDLRLVQPAAMQ